MQRRPFGFTIVELLVVIVVIGVLATIALVSYTGVSNKAVVASLQSDLNNASKQLRLYYTEHGNYPTSLDANNCPLGSAPSPDTAYCLKPSSGNTFTYQVDNSSTPPTFSLYATNSSSNINYRITSDSSTLATSLICPLNFIVVPGSTTYGTSDFCVMKYEAKRVGSTTTPISQASGLPWVSISQTNAIAYSQNVVVNGSACGASCHLITEAEWLTIAQNVLSVASNWSGGAVGSGYIYSGHNDNSPANALAADTNDSNGYAGTGNSPSSGANQKRTLTLTNGEVIWDMAGNVYDWTSGTSTTGQPGITGEATYAWKQWTAVTAPGTLSPNPSPATTALSGASTWTSTNGIGQLYSYAGEAGLRGFIRGGLWADGGAAGVLTLFLAYSPSGTYSGIGFRVSR